MSRKIPGSVKLGSLSVTWLEGGKAFEYGKQGKRYRYDVALRRAVEIPPSAPTAAGKAPAQKPGGGPVGMPARGRQLSPVISPNGRLIAVCRDRNLWLTDARGVVESQGHHRRRREDPHQERVASWVYGEELDQTSAMWWSPDSRKVAYYRFDESRVPDFYLELDQTQLQEHIDVEPYPKAGGPNPVVDLFVYDVEIEDDDRSSTSATASRSPTTWSATTSTASSGRPTARRCSSTAPTAGRTCSSLCRRRPEHREGAAW